IGWRIGIMSPRLSADQAALAAEAIANSLPRAYAYGAKELGLPLYSLASRARGDAAVHLANRLIEMFQLGRSLALEQGLIGLLRAGLPPEIERRILSTILGTYATIGQWPEARYRAPGPDEIELISTFSGRMPPDIAWDFAQI